MSKQENVTPKQKKIKTTETDPEIIDIMESADQDAKTAILNMLNMFKELKKNLKIMNKIRGDI